MAGLEPYADKMFAMRRQDMTYREIGDEVGASADAVRAWFRRKQEKQRNLLRGTPAAQRKSAISPDDLEALAPIVLPPPPPPACKIGATETTIVGGDFHFGPDSHSPECEEIFLNVIRDLRPKKVILNGDLPDMLAISHYPKDVRLKVDLGEERRQMHNFLYRLHEIVAPWDGEIVETNANHSGESQESRWWRYLSDRIPALAGDPEFQPLLSYRAMWYPGWARIRTVDYEVICPGLIALHGDLVRSKAAYTAKAMLEKWRHNLVHGHTHRMGATGYRVPGIAGQREHQMRAYEGGCMCNLTPTYGSGSATDWQNGFTIFRHDEDGDFGTEQVLIHNKKAVVTTLGATYKASE